ncbi:hypothetical protein LWI29_036033 [Acer saccharum]|uniref:Uncharacterized protein n=1 Tax=Acer saccharum TaxID=4024 RepID=A0AA39RXI3_ACESA|nr:hypothetical protein LWI29_036033 [Acer saccharum]
MQLTPNAYRNLMALYCLWRNLNFDAPTVNEIKHCLILRKSINEAGSYYLALYHSSRWLPIGEDRKRMKGKLDLPILDLDLIIGKTIRALKSVKVISKEDAKTVERQGIAPLDDPSLAEDYDAEGLDPNATTTGSGVAATTGSRVVATVSTNGIDAPMRGPSGPIGNLHKRKWKLPSDPKGPKVPRTLSGPSKSQNGSSELTSSEPIDSIFKDLGTIPKWEVSKIVMDGS